MELSIIIPHHNEGLAFIQTTVKQIKETIDITDYEIIIVDDGSDNRLPIIPGTIALHLPKNEGVGAAFDYGVKIARSDNLVLMGCDIRFESNGWASALLAEIELYPKSFTCTTCLPLTTDNQNLSDFKTSKKVRAGANLLLHINHSILPKKPEGYQNILEAQWRPYMENRNTDSFEIPCILGAFYGVKKSWYEYCDGFWGHRKWGTLEPYISLKSWMFGGSCRVAPRIETGHIFKPSGTHDTPQWVLYYNKMSVSTLLFDQYQELIDYINPVQPKKEAVVYYQEALDDILNKKKEYKMKIKLTAEHFCKINRIK